MMTKATSTPTTASQGPIMRQTKDYYNETETSCKLHEDLGVHIHNKDFKLR